MSQMKSQYQNQIANNWMVETFDFHGPWVECTFGPWKQIIEIDSNLWLF